MINSPILSFVCNFSKQARPGPKPLSVFAKTDAGCCTQDEDFKGLSMILLLDSLRRCPVAWIWSCTLDKFIVTYMSSSCLQKIFNLEFENEIAVKYRRITEDYGWIRRFECRTADSRAGTVRTMQAVHWWRNQVDRFCHLKIHVISLARSCLKISQIKSKCIL